MGGAAASTAMELAVGAAATEDASVGSVQEGIDLQPQQGGASSTGAGAVDVVGLQHSCPGFIAAAAEVPSARWEEPPVSAQ